MRKLILIAGVVLASATAQAGDNRSLSLSGSDVTAPATAPAKTPEAPKSAEAPQSVEAPKADAPRYVERPAVVEPKAETQRAETPKAETSKAAASRLQRANVEPRRRFARDPMSTRRFERPLRKRWIEARIIHALHRYGIYW